MKEEKLPASTMSGDRRRLCRLHLPSIQLPAARTGTSHTPSALPAALRGRTPGCLISRLNTPRFDSVHVWNRTGLQPLQLTQLGQPSQQLPCLCGTKSGLSCWFKSKPTPVQRMPPDWPEPGRSLPGRRGRQSQQSGSRENLDRYRRPRQISSNRFGCLILALPVARLSSLTSP